MTRVDRGFSLLDGAAEMGRTGLVLNRPLTFEEWSALGVGLQKVESGIQWALGDWINHGEANYGEKYAQAVEDTGYTYQALADFAYVCSRVRFSSRNENLRFTHHKVVAPLEPDEQEALLRAAAEGTWSVQALREAVRTFKKQLTAGSDESAPEPKRELPVKVTVTSAESSKSEPSEETTDVVEDLQRELSAADRELTEARRLVASLEKDDKDREIRALHSQLAQTNARINGLLAEKRAAVEQAEYYGKLLKRIAKAVGVEKYSDIIGKIAA